MFKELSKEKISVVEDNLNERWKEINILDKCINTRDKDFVLGQARERVVELETDQMEGGLFEDFYTIYQIALCIARYKSSRFFKFFLHSALLSAIC